MTDTRPYIIRVDFEGVRYGTAEPDALKVTYKPIHRTKRVIPSRGGLGPIREIEEVGKDKSTVVLHLGNRRDLPSPRNAHGRKGIWPNSAHFRLLDRKRHIRRLTEADQAALTQLDDEITAKLAELEALRDQRAEHVKSAWRRAEKVSISELEEKARS